MPDEELFRIEAEAADLTGPMTPMQGTQAYGGWYITSATPNVGTATWHFTIPTTGNYVVWCRVHAVDDDHDSFNVRADDGPWDTYDVAEGTWGPNWQWTRVNGRGGSGDPLTINPRVFHFTAGDHSLRFKAGKPLTRADRVIITNDFDFVATEGNTNSFWDVTPANPFYDFVENLARNEITSGCGNENYCPEDSVTRAQMAVLILKSKHGSDYVPPPATGTVFTDIRTGSFAAAWIEQLAEEGITSGCGNGKYCPNRAVTRKQMAVFLVKATHNPGYVPPAAVGVFNDVPPTNPFAPWIEKLAQQGITAGCGNGNFCPNRVNKRGQIAAFLVKTFDLP
jgi:S-layer homology domain